MAEFKSNWWLLVLPVCCHYILHFPVISWQSLFIRVNPAGKPPKWLCQWVWVIGNEKWEAEDWTEGFNIVGLRKGEWWERRKRSRRKRHCWLCKSAESVWFCFEPHGLLCKAEITQACVLYSDRGLLHMCCNFPAFSEYCGKRKYCTSAENIFSLDYV